MTKISRFPSSRKKSLGRARGASPKLLGFDHNDHGNALRIKAVHGSSLRYCHVLKKWFWYDGCRWATDTTGQARRMAKTAMLQFQRQAVETGNEKAEKFARHSLNEREITAALSSAQSEMYVTIDELDRDPYLLNCRNGTLDLRSGELQAHDPNDFITRLVPFNYDPGAQCPLFLKCLHEIMGAGEGATKGKRANAERAERLVLYLQRAFGYALTGDVREKVVFCFFGQGNNGKTTLLEAIRYVISEYSAQMMIDSLMAHRTRESTASLSDLADLRGARFVTTSEADEGKRLAEGKLKYLTAGMGRIKTCRKYENPIEFDATHKLFLDANHRPIVRGTDAAIWNRLKCIPFEVTIPDDQIDRGLPEKLQAEAKGILAWMVEGCMRWLDSGLQDPPEVSAAGEAWRTDMDPLKSWLEERCVDDPNGWCRIADLRRSYEVWTSENGEKYPLGARSFALHLEAKGYRLARRRVGGRVQRVREGLTLLDEPSVNA